MKITQNVRQNLFVKDCEVMNVIKNKVTLGASKPFEILHVSDTHITLADMRDGERKVNLAKNRISHFPNAEKNLDEISSLSKKFGAPIFHTGDLIDFVSLKNLEKAKMFTDENDCFLCAGNHEFSLFVGEAKEDEAYRNQSLERVQSSFKNDIRFSSRILNGVNFVAADNSYYRFEEFQLNELKNEVAKGFPVVLLLHTPLFNDEIYNFSMNELKNNCAYLMSVPEEKMKDYSPDRYEQQKEDEITHEAYEYILNEEKIKLLLTGHIHDDFETSFLHGKIQYTTGLDTVRVITID